MKTKKGKTVKSAKKPAQSIKDKPWYSAYQKKRNKERQEKYREDKTYRAKALEESRAAYRKGHAVSEKDCRANLGSLSDIGSIRFVRKGKSTVKMLSFTNAELAQAIEYSVVAVYRMQQDGRLPKPVMALHYPEGITVVPTPATHVYTKAEVAAIIKVLGEHQENVLHYRAAHTETRKRIYAAVKAARKG